MDNCFDCTYFITIISDYISIFYPKEHNLKNIKNLINKVIKQTSKLNNSIISQTYASLNKELARLYGHSY